MSSLKTFLLHAGITFLLLFVRFDRTRKWIRKRATAKTRKRVDDPKQVAKAVLRSSRWIPGSSCLTEALCCQAILLRNGYDARLILGLERTEPGKLDAHAWIELEDAVLIGDNGRLEAYKAMDDGRK